MIDDHEGVSDALADFANRLRSVAEALDLKVEARRELAAGRLLGEGADTASTKIGDRPSACRALRIGRYHVLLGELSKEPVPDAVRETLRVYRNQCVIARSHLSTGEALDLQLMLLGPRSSERSSLWRTAALTVERDDRVARKLVWLRPGDRESDDESFHEFIGRTFLARPWFQVTPAPDVELDRLVSISSDTAGLPRTTADEWQGIALDEENTADEIVAELVESWERRTQG